MRVWECTEDLCDELWVAEDEPDFCPECSFSIWHNAIQRGLEPNVSKPKYAGYTWEEAREAENKFLCDIPFHVPVPLPFEVVALSTLPREKWVGMPVFHPFEQMGDLTNWHRYELGVVTEVYPDPHFAAYGEWQCRFVLADYGSQGTLHYQPTNLWVPKPLAENLRVGA